MNYKLDNLINCMPHDLAIRMPDGSDVVFPASGTIARVGSVAGHRIGGIFYSAPTMGDVTNLPSPRYHCAVCGGKMGEDCASSGHDFMPELDTIVVSAMVAQSCNGRSDVFSPGTGPNDGCIRENGNVVAVTRLIQAPKGRKAQ